MTLLAKSAEALYWAGRYFERAEDLARVIEAHGDAHFDIPVGADVGWRPLLEIAGVEKAFATRLDARRSTVDEPLETRIVRFLLTDHDNPSSISTSLESGRRNLRIARPVVPREVWEACNELWLGLDTGDADSYPLDGSGRDGRVPTLRRVIDGCQRLHGVLLGTMRRDEALVFVQLGQHIERIDMTARVLSVRADSIIPDVADAYDEVRRTAVLRSLAALQSFRRVASSATDPQSVLRFLVLDERFPRAMAACLSEIIGNLKALPLGDDPMAAAADLMVSVADAPLSRMGAAELRVFGEEVQGAVGGLHERIVTTYFSRTYKTADDETAERLPALPARAPLEENPATPTRRYHIRHRTLYTYAAAAAQSFNEAHLRPRDTVRQQVLSHHLAIDPEPVSCFEHHDAFGNTMASFQVKGGFRRLEVVATSEVVLVAPAVPTSGPPWESALRVLHSDRLPVAREARRYLSPSRLVPTAPSLAEYAHPSFTRGRPLVEGAIDLCSRIHTDFQYDPGFTTVTTPLLEVFAHRRGVCQDFAQLMVGCLRSLGLAARYVSGYLETAPAPDQEKLVGADASHAWPSIFLPGWGWLDMDPTNDQLVDDSYVTLGWGRDFWDVSPLRGSIDGGAGSQTLEVGVDVERVEDTVPRPS